MPGGAQASCSALDWANVDLALRALRVVRAWDHGDRVFIAPKSSAAERIVPIARCWRARGPRPPATPI